MNTTTVTFSRNSYNNCGLKIVYDVMLKYHEFLVRQSAVISLVDSIHTSKDWDYFSKNILYLSALVDGTQKDSDLKDLHKSLKFRESLAKCHLRLAKTKSKEKVVCICICV